MRSITSPLLSALQQQSVKYATGLRVKVIGKERLAREIFGFSLSLLRARRSFPMTFTLSPVAYFSLCCCRALRNGEVMLRIRFHGRGGQGMKTASRILG